MEKYVPIQTNKQNGNFNRKSYNLPVRYLPKFRETFGSTLNNVSNEEFIIWCKNNNVTLYKTVIETVEVKIDEY